MPIGLTTLGAPTTFSAPVRISTQAQKLDGALLLHSKLIDCSRDLAANATPTTRSLLSSRAASSSPSRECLWDDTEDAIENTLLHVGGHIFTINRELGRGNFGVVFEATVRGDSGQVTVAIKRSKISSNSEFDFSSEQQVRQFLTECAVLQRLGEKLPQHCPSRIPKYLAHAAQPSMITLAMTKASGHPLDAWLYGMEKGEVVAVTPEDYIRCSFPCGHRCYNLLLDFEGACHMVARLVAQLAPVFSALQGIAFHRDISAHNILIDDAPCPLGGSPNFTLIDFGFAVDTQEWLQGWRTLDVSGDPRYWSAAHWVKLFFSPDVLEQNYPAFARLFRDRLDQYSFGIVALEFLFGLWRDPSSDEAPNKAWQAVAHARAAWQNYWWHALSCRQAVVKHPSNLPVLRQAVVDSGLCAGLLAAHVALCDALHRVSVEWACGPEAIVGALFRAVASLIDPSSTASWGSVSECVSGLAMC